jgi:uncharacterized SAM-dependent methyltransferase
MSNGTRDAEKGVNSRCFLWFGSSITNMDPEEVISFLRSLSSDHMPHVDDKILIGIDLCGDVDKIKASYGENFPIREQFMRNAIQNTGEILGGDARGILDGHAERWEYVARWDSASRRHMVSVASLFEILLTDNSSDLFDPKKI